MFAQQLSTKGFTSLFLVSCFSSANACLFWLLVLCHFTLRSSGARALCNHIRLQGHSPKWLSENEHMVTELQQSSYPRGRWPCDSPHKKGKLIKIEVLSPLPNRDTSCNRRANIYLQVGHPNVFLSGLEDAQTLIFLKDDVPCFQETFQAKQ